ncbi:MAG: hypothetical protein Q9164_006251, partial [Protoblastenia rupestris]
MPHPRHQLQINSVEGGVDDTEEAQRVTHNGPSSTGSSEKETHQSSNQTLPKVASEEDLIDLFADSNPTDRKDMPKPEPQKHPFKVLLPTKNPSRPRVLDCGEASGRGPPSASDEKVTKQTKPADSKKAAHKKRHHKRAQSDDTKLAAEDVVKDSSVGDNEAWDFYRRINSQHRQALAQNTMFTLPLNHLHTHNTFLHSNMRSSLPSSDPAVLNGFAQCNNTAQRLLKRATNRNVNWAAQMQRIQDAYEARLSEEKRMSEALLRQMQVEVE